MQTDSKKHITDNDANNVLVHKPSFRLWATDDLIDCLPKNYDKSCENL